MDDTGWITVVFARPCGRLGLILWEKDPDGRIPTTSPQFLNCFEHQGLALLWTPPYPLDPSLTAASPNYELRLGDAVGEAYAPVPRMSVHAVPDPAVQGRPVNVYKALVDPPDVLRMSELHRAFVPLAPILAVQRLVDVWFCVSSSEVPHNHGFCLRPRVCTFVDLGPLRGVPSLLEVS